MFLLLCALCFPGILSGLMPAATARTLPEPTPAPPVHAPVAPALPFYQSNWNAFPAGGTPDDWIDPERDGYHYPWLYPGNWHIVASPDNPAIQYYEQSQQLPQPALTFRRYDGMAFGQDNGLLPVYYHVDVTMRPIQSKYFFAPVGEAAVQVYYLDPTHYVEIDVRNTQVMLWEDDGGFPGQANNWILYWSQPLQTHPGQNRRVGADVDTVHHLITIYIEGHAVAMLNLPFISTRPHWVALRAAGQWIDYASVRIQELPPPYQVLHLAPATGQTFGSVPWWQSPRRLALIALCLLVVLWQCVRLIQKRRKMGMSDQQLVMAPFSRDMRFVLDTRKTRPVEGGVADRPDRG
jgi:hypothetical protein